MSNDLYPMNAAELMDRAVHVYKKSFGKQLAFSAIFGVITYFASVILLFIFFMVAIDFAGVALFSAFTPIVGGGAAYGSGVILSVLLLVLVIVLPFVFLWYAISSAGHCVISGPAFFGFKAKTPFKQLPPMAGRIFFALIAQAIASLPFVGVAVLFVVSGMFEVLIARAPWIFALMNFIFLVLLLLYLNVFSLSVAVAVFEKKTFFNALLRSWVLIKGEYWKIAGMRLVWLLSTGIISMALSGVFALANILIALFITTTGMGMVGAAILGIVNMFAMLVSIAVTIIVRPLDGVFNATLYFNQRIKKEGLDIEARLGRLLS